MLSTILRAVRFLLSDRLRLCQNWILLVALPIGNGAPRSDQFGFVSLGHKVTNLTAHSIPTSNEECRERLRFRLRFPICSR